jgi:asparagine synthase (glutamine-hydrolysing)
MPYLFGIHSREKRRINEEKLCRMMDSVFREPFYNSGRYVNDDLGLYMGWIGHKDSFEDGMPIMNESGQIALFVSGEVFHDRNVEGFSRDQSNTSSDGNASDLVRQYEERGEAFIEELNGQFSGVLVDGRIKKAFLFNDRYGMGRVFVHEGKSGFYFSTTARALLKVLPETCDFDPTGIAEYLTCGATIGNRSLYKGISILPSSSCWTLANGDVEKKSVYFHRADWEVQESLDRKHFDEEVIDSIPAVVRKYGEARQTIGISLTGGLDSRIVVACLDMERRQYPCYTFGSMYRDTFDVRIARDVAKVCRQNHNVLILGQDCLKEFPTYIEKAVSLSDGYLGLSGAAELYVNSLARTIAPIRLTGNYGSELLRGVRAFKASMPQAMCLTADFHEYLKQAQQTFKQLEMVDPLSFVMFNLAPHQGYGRLSIERSQVIMRTPFMDNDIVKLIYRRPANYIDGIALSSSLIKKYRSELLEIPTDRGDLGTNNQFENYLLRMKRRALFKGEYWMSHGMPRWVAATMKMMPWLTLEEKMLGRHKFQHFRSWLRKELAVYVRDMLQTSKYLPAFFEKKRLDSMLNEHLEGKNNYLDEIDKTLSIILSVKLFFSNESQ